MEVTAAKHGVCSLKEVLFLCHVVLECIVAMTIVLLKPCIISCLKTFSAD